MGTTTKMESRPSKKHFKKRTDSNEAENETHRHSSKKSRGRSPQEPKKKEFRREKGFKDMPDLIETSSRKTPRVIERNSPVITKDEMHSKRRHSGIVENSNKKTLHQKKGFQKKYDVAESAPRRSNRGNQRDSLDISNKRCDDKFPVDADNVNGKKRQAGLRDNSDKEIPGQKKSFQSKTDRAGQKKCFEENSDAVDSPKRKKKRVMRIDPHDISNKRIDDGVSIDGKKVEKKVDTEANNEVSMNAQFRAIQPSPSILSFVEDNLLGRRRLIELRRAGYNIDLSTPLDNVPLSTSSERERIEESVFRNRLSFFAAAKIASSFPPAELPEIAFAGRSNVGKSSLLNALTRQWGVVRTSDKPGLTQTINFFNLGPKLRLVDLPGYGFAYAKEEVKDAWEELVKEYVSTRVGLKRVCLLIDTKWGMKPRDRELIDLMERSQTKYQIVLTKTDTVFPIDVARRAMQIEESLNANRSSVQPLMMVSSKTGAGIRSLRTVLGKVLRFAKV